jgi:DNA-binding transcriptional regulator YiaG
MDSDNRERGILSPADRAYLRGETEPASVQSERNTRARIRNRTRDGILDLELLVEHLSDHDRELIFGEQFEEMDGTAAFDALVSAVAFCYQGIEDTSLAFETVLREAINVAEASNDRAATVDLDLTFQSRNADQLRHKLETGETLSLTEIAYLHANDTVSRSELARYLGDAETAHSDIDDGRIQSKVNDF